MYSNTVLKLQAYMTGMRVKSTEKGKNYKKGRIYLTPFALVRRYLDQRGRYIYKIVNIHLLEQLEPQTPASQSSPLPSLAGQTWPLYGLAAPDSGLPAPGRARQNRARSKRRVGSSAVVTIQRTQVVGVLKYPGYMP